MECQVEIDGFMLRTKCSEIYSFLAFLGGFTLASQVSPFTFINDSLNVSTLYLWI